MSLAELDVNGSSPKSVGDLVLSDTRKTYLTLSAVGEVGPVCHRDPSAPARARGPLELERDPDIVTETELRLMWGDR